MLFPGIEHRAAVAASPVFLVVGVVVVAVATVAGAWLARGRDHHRQVWFAAAAGALLVISLVHVVPDAWAGAAGAGMSPWWVPAVAVVSFAVSAVVGRLGCTCQADEEHAGGVGSAAALTVHRFLEGAALGLTGVITAAAISVHALGEGLAVGALLRTQPRRLACWLIVMCAGPVVGAVTVDAIPSLQVAEPLLLAVAGGIIAQAARISLRAAFPRHGTRWLASAMAVAVAAVATTLAVHAVG